MTHLILPHTMINCSFLYILAFSFMSSGHPSVCLSLAVGCPSELHPGPVIFRSFLGTSQGLGLGFRKATDWTPIRVVRPSAVTVVLPEGPSSGRVGEVSGPVTSSKRPPIEPIPGRCDLVCGWSCPRKGLSSGSSRPGHPEQL
jgi:hypothetical protein